jgi:twitching motility protein PilU
MDRIINFFPEERHKQLLSDLALNLRGIISQRLIPTIDGRRCAAIEILLGTPRAADLISKGGVNELKELMEKSAEQGMQTFDMALFKLYKERKITIEEALKNADSKNNLRLRIRLDENPAAKLKKIEEQKAARAAARSRTSKEEKSSPPAADKKKEEPRADSGPQGLSLVSMEGDDEP